MFLYNLIMAAENGASEGQLRATAGGLFCLFFFFSLYRSITLSCVLFMTTCFITTVCTCAYICVLRVIYKACS